MRVPSMRAPSTRAHAAGPATGNQEHVGNHGYLSLGLPGPTIGNQENLRNHVCLSLGLHGPTIGNQDILEIMDI